MRLFKISLIKMSRWLLSILIVYSIWFKDAYTNVPLILYGSTILATACVVIDCVHKRKIRLSIFPTMLMIYGIYSLLTGLFVAKDTNWLISILITYFAFSIIIFDCNYVSQTMGDYRWIINSILFASVLCIFQTIFLGRDYQTETIVRTMGERNNPNTLAFTMIMGLSMLFLKCRPNKIRFSRVILCVIPYILVIIMTGSRKGLVCGLALVCMWILTVLGAEKGFTKRKLRVIAIVVIFGAFGAYYAVTEFVNTASFERFLLFSAGQNSRTVLAIHGIEFWKKSPIIGIGFGQYQILSPYGIYSHSSYIECLACTGVLGILIFFGPLVANAVKLFYGSFGKHTSDRYMNRLCLAIAVIEFVMGVGQIYFYDDISHLLMLMLCFVFANGNQVEERVRQSGRLGERCSTVV